MTLNEQQFSPAPSLTTARVSGILNSARIERYSEKTGGDRIVRVGAGSRKAKTKVQTSGIEIVPEVHSRRNPGGRRSYTNLYSGRYEVGYRPGYSGSSKSHSPEEISSLLESAKSALTNAGLKISPHHREDRFWVHE